MWEAYKTSGDREWGDYAPTRETEDDLLALYQSGDWEYRN